MNITSQILSVIGAWFLFSQLVWAHPADSTELRYYPKIEKLSSLHRELLFSNMPMGNEKPSATAEFSFSNIKTEFPVSNDVLKDRREAIAVMEEIALDSKWIASLSTQDIVTLPIGIKHYINEVEYAIGIAKATIYKDYSVLTVFARVRLPQVNEKGEPIELFFGADNVKLSREGGIFGDANLVLLGDVQIPFNAGNWLLELKGGFDYRTGLTQNLSYVSMDCSGVREMGLSANVQFSRNLILPVTLDGEALPPTKNVQRIDGSSAQIPNRVTGEFDMVVSDWNDIVAAIDLQPFVLAKHPDKFVFELSEAIFDFSDIRTPNIPFPAHYREKGLLLPSVDNWRGVYVQSLEVALPKTFKTTETILGKERVRFGAADMIIDNFGVSGYFFAENIISLDKGRTNDSQAWAYSVDYLDVELVTNRIASAAFSGEIVLPIAENNKNGNGADKKLGLGYAGLISEEEYHIRVATTDTLDFNLWKAKAQLLPNSYVELNVENDNFYPIAVLNGRMTITANQKESLDAGDGTIIDGKNQKHTVNFKGIEFQDLVLQTKSPVLQVGYFGYTDELKLMNFPVSISDISLTATEYRSALGFDLNVNLMETGDKGFAGKTRLEIIGNFKEENYRQRWAYEKLDLKEIYLNADMGAFALEGSLILMENHPEYGDGFSASLTATMAAFNGLTVSANAIFGKSDFRYWYFDAMVSNLPTGNSPIGLYGFGGGAFYHMKRRGFGSAFAPSGLAYLPDNEKGLGLKAMVLFSVINGSAFNGGAGFEILFNKSGGISKMGLYGEGHLMKDLPGGDALNQALGKLNEQKDKLEKYLDNTGIGNAAVSNKLAKSFVDRAQEEYPSSLEGQAGISGYVGIEYDFDNKVLHGNLDVYVNVAGGILQGRASGGRAGWAEMHFAPDTWHLYLGTPSDRLGLKLGVGPISAQTGGYFMIGHKIPASPPPPPIVADILGVDIQQLDYMRDENALGDGRGFAFGTDFSVDTGDLKFLLFYARFQAGAGFDIMLKDYGEAQCSNTGDQVGINGWYANGQAYAYLQGELGIRVKLFFINKRIPIVKGGAAVLLQAKAPNPVWMRGYVGGHYDLLGGLIKGNFNFKVTIGKECKFENASPLAGLKIISDLTPGDNEKEVDVFVAPQVAFNMAVEKVLTLPEDDGDHIYKIVLEEFRILDENDIPITGSITWNQNHNAATFVPEDILPPASTLRVSAEVGFQEKINGIFKTIMVNGVPAKEIEERTFTTGTAPEYIPLQNIVYAYPVIDQKYFYPKEHSNGYIQLKQGQDYLFDNAQWKSEIEIIDANGKTSKLDFTYSKASNSLSYTLPKIKNETLYGLVIVSRPKNGAASTTASTTEAQTDLGDDNSLTISQREAQRVSKDGSLERINYNFKTSEYSTFAQKIQRIKVSDHGWDKLSSNIIYLFNSIQNHEAFDTAELIGNEYTDHRPMVFARSDLADVYFLQDINPILYQKYTTGPYALKREAEPYGIPPRKALPLFSNYLTNIAYGVNRNWTATHFPFRYNLPEAYFEDYRTVKTSVMNDYVNGLLPLSSTYTSILDTRYEFMRKGAYRIDLQYRLPGGKIGSKASLDYKNPLNFR